MRPRVWLIAAGVFALAFFGGRRLAALLLLLLNAAVLTHLALVLVRRTVLTVAAHLAPQPTPMPDDSLRVTVLIPCRDEADALPATFAAWDAVTYPRDKLEVIFIDDQSTDDTHALLAIFTAEHDWARVVRRKGRPYTKGASLNFGLIAAAPSDAVAVFDADARPDPDCLQALVGSLSRGCDAVAGRMLPADTGTAVGAYVAVESAVHQRLTMAGADRAHRSAALLGSAYLLRRSVIDELGFASGHRLEDIDLTMRLWRRGQTIASSNAARCEHDPPRDIRAFRTQRRDWGRGFHALAREHWHGLLLSAPSLPAAVDRLLFATGYLDRLTWLLAVALACLAKTFPTLWMPWWVPAVALAAPLLQVPLALRADRRPIAGLAKLPLGALLVVFDFASEIAALVADLLGRPLPWRRTARAHREPST